MMKLTLLSAAIASAAAFAPAPQASTSSALSVSVGSKYENEIGVQVPVSATLSSVRRDLLRCCFLARSTTL